MILDPDKTRMITHAIETSAKDTGMVSFDQSLLELLSQNKIDLKEAMKLTNNPEDFYLKYSGVKSGHERTVPMDADHRIAQPADLDELQSFDLDVDDGN